LTNDFDQVIEFSNRNDFDSHIEMQFPRYTSVLDLGAGIRPFRCQEVEFHIITEINRPYLEFVSGEFNKTNNHLLLCDDAEHLLSTLMDESVDLIVMSDFIEHVEKEKGIRIIELAKRKCKQGLVIFTPLGFMPQDYNHDELDAWGMNRSVHQRHLPGWQPIDFANDTKWKIFICHNYHFQDAHGARLEVPHGAMYAIYQREEALSSYSVISSQRRFDLEILFKAQSIERDAAITERDADITERDEIKNSEVWRFTKPIRLLIFRLRNF